MRSRVLAAADTAAERAGRRAIIHALRASLRASPGEQTLARGRAGGAQAYSHIRRDVLHPLGPDGVRPYADFTGEAAIGPFALVSRPAAEPRLADDPEWPGRTDLELAWRMVEAYGSAQFKYGSVFYGQMDRNWGPVGLAGHRRQQLRLSPGRGGLRSVRASSRASGSQPMAADR